MAARRKRIEHHWLVVETKHREEFVAARHLRQQDWEVYHPRCRKRDAKGIVSEIVSYFPGYIFARHDATMRWRSINGSRGVKSVLMGAGEIPSLARDQDVVRLRDSEDESGYIRIETDPPLFCLMEAVTALRGMFPGLTGRVTGTLSAVRVKVLFDMLILGQEVSTELEMHTRDLARAVA